MSREDLLNFEENFNKFPLCAAIKDSSLRGKLKDFLRAWNDPHHKAWRENHCPEMVDHALHHAQNVFWIANRIFYDNENLKNLNDSEIFCFVFAVWLHDIGMSKLLFSPTFDDLNDLNEFLDAYGVEPLRDLSEIRCVWVRKHHALLSKYLITKKPDQLGLGLGYEEDFRKIIGELCFHHSSRTKLTTDESDSHKEYYKSTPLIKRSKGFFNLRVGEEVLKVNVLYLAALLRFVDGCDQTKQRLIKRDLAQALEARNKSVSQTIWTKISNHIKSKKESLGDEYENILNTWEKYKRAYDEPISEDILNVFMDICRPHEALISVVPEIEEFKRIALQTRGHFKYKKSVEDVYFKNGKIILYLADPHNQRDVERVKTDIIGELKTAQSILNNPPNDERDFSIPYNENSLTEETECSQDELEVPLYEYGSEDLEKKREPKPYPQYTSKCKCSLIGNDWCQKKALRCFSIGILKYPIEFLTGHPEKESYRYKDVKCELVDSNLKLPSDIERVRNKLISEYKTQITKTTDFVDNPTIRLEDWGITNTQEGVEMVLLFSYDTYFKAIITNFSLDKKVLRGKGELLSIREKYVENPTDFKKSVLGNHLGFTLNLVTRDNKVILTKRGEKVAVYPNLFNTAVSGIMSPDDIDENGIPNPFYSAKRETEEEIGLQIDIRDIVFHGLVIEYEHCKPELIGEIKLDKTLDEIFSLMSFVRDRYEYNEIIIKDFTPGELFPLLKDEEWIPQAAVCLIFCLIKKYGLEEVEKAFSSSFSSFRFRQ